MNREVGPPAGDGYEPLRPPEPVPAPLLPEEMASADSYWAPHNGDDNRTDDNPSEDADDSWSDSDWYGSDAEQDAASHSSDQVEWAKNAQWAKPEPEAEPAEPEPYLANSTSTDPARPSGFGGKHARRGMTSSLSVTPAAPVTGPSGPRLDYIPRHSAEGNSDAVSATELTDILAKVREDPTEAPRADRPESVRRARQQREQPPPEIPVAAIEQDPAAPPGKRVKVVLSQRRGQARPVRTVVDVQELTKVGEVLSSNLIRSQLALTLRIAAIALLGVGALPAVFFYVPALAAIEVFGLRLPWLLLGLAVYPFLLFLGWMYYRGADKLEKIFAEHLSF